MKTVLLITSLFLFAFNSKTQEKCSISKGNWIGNLQLTETIKLPFNFIVSESDDKTILTVLNGEEEIELIEGTCLNDTFRFLFPVFNSELVFTIKSDQKINGFWENHIKNNYTIPFTGDFSFAERFPVNSTDQSSNFNGRWQTMFSKDGVDEYPALGVFHQKGTFVSGTFLTETGDYRFLEGNVYGNQLFLSCFDGSHAFLFTAKQNEQGVLIGDFYSGKHWKSEWSATRNDEFELPSPDSITYVIENAAPLSFSLIGLDEKMYTYPNRETQDKVVIIQILGTWCPNCMDETRYFKELYEKYHKDGLEIISIGYEATEDPLRQLEALQSYKKKLGLDFTFLVGGQASKGLASQHFPALNEITSFPTSIFIGRDGTIQRVHTGFNGPSTEKYYEAYIQKTEMLIKEMLAN